MEGYKTTLLYTFRTSGAESKLKARNLALLDPEPRQTAAGLRPLLDARTLHTLLVLLTTAVAGSSGPWAFNTLTHEHLGQRPKDVQVLLNIYTIYDHEHYIQSFSTLMSCSS